MADEIRVTRDDDTLAAGTHQHGREIRNEADVEAVIPPRPTVAPAAPAAAAPRTGAPTGPAGDPNTVRAEIEQTRARMSETIDEIEDALLRKKEQIEDRLDFLAPVRERPLASVGIVFGAGLLLGLLTGGDDDEDEDDDDYEAEDLESRAEMWERRARRLLRIAREQEEEIESLTAARRTRLNARASRADVYPDEEYVDEESYDDGYDSREYLVGDDDDPRTSRMQGGGSSLADKVADFFTDAIRQLFVPGPRAG